MELRDYIFVLRRRFLWFVTFIVLTLMVFYIVYLLQNKYYSYEIRLFYQPKITSLPIQVIAKSTIDIQFTKNPDYWVQFMRKEEFFNDIVFIYNYLTRNDKKLLDFKDIDRKKVSDMVNSAKKLSVTPSERENIIKIASDSIRVYITSDNKFLVIECINTDRDTAEFLTTAVAFAYFYYGYSEAVSGIDELKRYYLENINFINSEISKIESFSRDNDSNLQTDYDITKGLINNLHLQILRLYTERISYKEKIKEVSNYMSDPHIQEELNAPYKSERTIQLEKELFDSKVKLNNLKMNVTEEHPEYKKLVNTIKILTDNIVEGRRKDLVNYTKNLQNLLKECEVKIESLTIQKLELEEKMNVLKNKYEKNIDDVNKRKELMEQLQVTKGEVTRLDAILTQAPNYFSFYMSSAPELMSESKKPVTRYLYLWLLFSMVIGIIGAYGRESMDTTIKSEFDIKKYLNLPILGIVPYIKDLQIVFKEDVGHKNIEEKVVLQELYTAIASIIDEKCRIGFKKILSVTSTLKYEGKSVCSYNIAYALSRLNRKVLFIDGDARSPVIHKFFSVDNKKGFFNLHTENISDVIVKINKNLDFMPSGVTAGNPVEYLARGGSKEILKGLKNRYDFILLDLPPLINVSDSLIFSKMSDGVVLIVAAGEINRNVAKWSKHLLGGINVDILGVVLNKAFVGITPTYYTYSHRNKNYSAIPSK